MESTGKTAYLVPDFVRDFSCKCGACRSCCCVGWNVSVAEDEYFRLIGMECPPELRRRLDDAFFIPHDASPERYALLNHNYLGECPLRLESGLCALQRQLGEDALPRVCRMYPRSVDETLMEATLANSCEAVIEGFLFREAPITFAREPLPWACGETKAAPVTDDGRLALRMRLIGIMQDRRLALRYRIAVVGDALGAGLPKRAEFALRLPALLKLAEIYEEISPSIGEYCKNTHDALCNCDEDGYARLALAHDERFPRLSLVMEHTLVNHMFYEKFPYARQAATFRDAFVSLCGTYGFLRILCVGNSKRITCDAALVDMLGAAFRVVEHTGFDHNVDAVMHNMGYSQDDADMLIML